MSPVYHLVHLPARDISVIRDPLALRGEIVASPTPLNHRDLGEIGLLRHRGGGEDTPPQTHPLGGGADTPLQTEEGAGTIPQEGGITHPPTHADATNTRRPPENCIPLVDTGGEIVLHQGGVVAHLLGVVGDQRPPPPPSPPPPGVVEADHCLRHCPLGQACLAAGHRLGIGATPTEVGGGPGHMIVITGAEGEGGGTKAERGMGVAAEAGITGAGPPAGKL